ncbi:DNA phosphorothioation-dependent restriction protein DptG [Alkalihalophilus pseudofirmus]|uniref:DNA phosphorothioation-dependent restriction protein DptG n=1 Tax=Alkalihalophilus pseudofirmus TaxID=79885 RepID=A0AAJ2NKU9_ALKPS|nr:DNA phosphorothioation-dependent restriction protein DptG [Alkalihalophilus pseudofirmus]MDV2884691.1 DNA phosphorothioation-dependent restriction protein DptG [Alkalihalophilus pseudofirmus]
MSDYQYMLLIEDIKKSLKQNKNGSLTHHKPTDIKIDILPFTTKRPNKAVRERFPHILSEFTRLITKVKLEEDKIAETQVIGNPILHNLIAEVEHENDDIRFDLERFLNDFLYENDSNIKPFHPYVYNFLNFSDKNRMSQESSYAQFAKDILVGRDHNLQSLFDKNEGEDILISLVLDNLKSIKPDEEVKKIKYTSMLNIVGTMFQKDLLYLSKHKDYFLQHYPLLVKYYFFLYVSQLALKLEQFTNADYDALTPLYFGLEWEALNKRRNAASDISSYKYLKDKLPNLFVHRQTLLYLSMNNISEEQDKVMSYLEINNALNDGKLEQRNSYLDDLKSWIQQYVELTNINIELTESEKFHDLAQQLFTCLKQGMNSDACKKYGESVEDAASSFLKQRGSLGYTLNLTQDFLLLMVAVCVKEERMPLKQLFSELENRGIALDRYSQKEVIDLLDNLNIIDKKSDSGDAQYVKPIL